MTKQAEPEQIAPQMTNKQIGIIGVVIATIILVIVIIAATSNHAPKSLVDTASGKVETTTAAAIKAYIDSYYVYEENYPSDYQALIDFKPENSADLVKYESKLKDFDDIEPTERLFKKIEDYKRVTSQLFKDHGIISNERAHFRNYASYILRQGSINEQDTFIRGLNTPLFVRSKSIYRRYENT